MSCKQLALAFFRTGVLGYGGGPSTIPLIRYEAVEHYRWIDDREFGEILAMANALPGPIATKMAAYLGYRVKGSAGAFAAILAHILPSLIVLIALLSYLYSMKDSPMVQGMIHAIGPVIGVMIAVMAFQFGGRSKQRFGWLSASLLLLLALAALEGLHLHPAIVIILFVAGMLLKAWRSGRGGK